MSNKGRSSKGPSDFRRIARVEKEVREIVGGYISKSLRGRYGCLVSVTRVLANKDLRGAKVFVILTSTGSEPIAAASKKKVVSDLQSQAREMQSILNDELPMRYCPKLTFLYDEGFDHALKVEGILRDLSGSGNSKS